MFRVFSFNSDPQVMVGWLVGWLVLWHVNPCWDIFMPKSAFLCLKFVKVKNKDKSVKYLLSYQDLKKKMKSQKETVFGEALAFTINNVWLDYLASYFCCFLMQYSGLPISDPHCLFNSHWNRLSGWLGLWHINSWVTIVNQMFWNILVKWGTI